MPTPVLGPQAEALVAACEAFLASDRSVLPRVAARALAPVLEALTAFLVAAAEGQQVIQVFRYPIGDNGVRAPANMLSSLAGVVAYDTENKRFGWTTVRVIEVNENTRAEVSIEGFREVSVEDLAELRVELWEIAEFIKNVATKVAFHQVEVKATQAPARA